MSPTHELERFTASRAGASVETDLPGFHTATWDVQGAFLEQDPNDVDRIFTNRVHPVVLGCLQNTGSPIDSLQTENYMWKVSKVQPRPQYDLSPSGGTAFLFHKLYLENFENLDFFKVTENIVGCEFLYSGQKMRVISVFVDDGATAEPEFIQLVTHLLNYPDKDSTTILMGNFNAEIGKSDTLNMNSLVGPQLMHDTSNHNGVLLKRLITTTGFVLSSSFSDSETTMETWANRHRPAQHDHLLQSHMGRVKIEAYEARYIDRIRTNHKCVFATIAICKDRMEIPLNQPEMALISPPSVASSTPFDDSEVPTVRGFKAATINVQGAASTQEELDAIDLALSSKQIVMACVQCTGLTTNFIETENYFWKVATARPRPQYGMTMSGGSAILLQKSHKSEFEDIEFLDVTENMLAYKCIYFGRKLQIISTYLADDETAKSEFRDLILYLEKTTDSEVTTLLMGDFHAEVGCQDKPYLKIGTMLRHQISNSNGVLLKELIELIDFKLHSTFSTSNSVLVTVADRGNEYQWDHVIVSHYDHFTVGHSRAEWLSNVSTNHKALLTDFSVKTEPKTNAAIEEPLKLATNCLKMVSWNAYNRAKRRHTPEDIDKALLGVTSAQNEPVSSIVVQIACLQNVWLDQKEVYETTNFKWRATGLGTAILFHKSFLHEVTTLKFNQIQEKILECTFIWHNQMFRVVSAHIPCDEMSQNKFQSLATYLNSVHNERVFTLLAGDLKAKIGNEALMTLCAQVRGRNAVKRIGRQLKHENSTVNGELLLELLRGTQLQPRSIIDVLSAIPKRATEDNTVNTLSGVILCNADSEKLWARVTPKKMPLESLNSFVLWVDILVKISSTIDEPVPSTSTAFKRVYSPVCEQTDSSAELLIAGTLNMSGLCVSQAALDAFDTVFDREPTPTEHFQLLCLQNTGLEKSTHTTRSFNWKISTSGTAIVMHKDLCARITGDITFFEVTDKILVCEFIVFDKPLRLISVYTPDGAVAKSEFTQLITYLMEHTENGVTTVVMGDFNAMVGRNDCENVNLDLSEYNLPHEHSNANGVLLKGLLSLTNYRFVSSLCCLQSVASTAELGTVKRPVQIDHVLASPHSEFGVRLLTAKWLTEIETNHKVLVTEISGQPHMSKRVRRYSDE